MIGLGPKRAGPLSILCIGAHSDDLEIAVFGTIVRLLEQHPGSRVCWTVLSGTDERKLEARRSAEVLLEPAADVQIVQHDFRDGFFPFVGVEVKEAFETLKAGFAPDIVFTHARADRHQDHRLVAELTWNTWRDHLILEYEIPKYEGDLGRPNIYVPLESAVVDRKLDHLERHFASQRSKHWYDRAVFHGLMRLRGLECRAPSGFAEAFMASKIVLG